MVTQNGANPKTRVRAHRGKNYEISLAHPIADLYGWSSDEEMDALVESINEVGQKKKIERLPDGRIIDGRRRELAARINGTAPEYETLDLKSYQEILAHVNAVNNQRRHASDSQRAMCAADLANLKVGQRTSRAGGDEPAVSQEQAAKLFNVGRQSVNRAAAVLTRGIRELADVVRDGRLDVKRAALVTVLPRDQQYTVATAADPKQVAIRLLEAAEPAYPATSVPQHQRTALRQRVEHFGSDLISGLRQLDANPRIGGFLKRRQHFVRNITDIREELRRLVDGAPSTDWPAAQHGHDLLGTPIPKNLRDDFACDELVQDWRDLTHIASALATAKGYLPWLKPEVHDVQARAARYLFDTIPFAVCVHCEGRGTGCGPCMTSGYHPFWSCRAGNNGPDAQAAAKKVGEK